MRTFSTGRRAVSSYVSCDGDADADAELKDGLAFSIEGRLGRTCAGTKGVEAHMVSLGWLLGMKCVRTVCSVVI